MTCETCPNHTDNTCYHENASNGNDSQHSKIDFMVGYFIPKPKFRLIARPADPYFEHENWGNC